MFTDIVFPRNNEKKFIEMAKKLDIDSLCFIYSDKNHDDINKINNKIKEIEDKTGLKLFTGLLVEPRNINKLRRLTMLSLIKASEQNRGIIEQAEPDIIFDLEGSSRKDFIYNRNSGLNHILCSIANKNEVIIGIDIGSLLKNKNKHVIIGRMKQNIKLCQKYRVKIAIASFAKDPYEMRSSHELKSLLATIGTNTKYQKEALDNTFLRIQKNIEKSSPDYVSNGIHLIKA